MNDLQPVNTSQYPVHGAGLGLRRPLVDKLMADPPTDVDFMEVVERVPDTRNVETELQQNEEKQRDNEDRNER